jgi:transcriptional regulator with XRE-family HTH domain
MPQAIAIADALKRALRARGITYAALAVRIGMSEASVKRMFAQRTFTLARLDRICDAAGIDFAELTRGFNPEDRLIARLTAEQEAGIVAEPKLFLAAICVLNLLDFDDMLSLYKFEPAELVGLLTRLDRIGFIELLPNNRIKPLVARTFAWIPNGPIMQAFKRNAADFFDSDFGKPGELMLLLNGRLSHASTVALVERLKRVAREFSDQHRDDAALPAVERPAVSLLIACRPWRISAMRPLERAEAGQGARRGRKRAR